jgi:hypothetical protein
MTSLDLKDIRVQESGKRKYVRGIDEYSVKGGVVR